MVNGKCTSQMIDLDYEFEWMSERHRCLSMFFAESVWNEAHGGEVLFCDEVGPHETK